MDLGIGADRVIVRRLMRLIHRMRLTLAVLALASAAFAAPAGAVQLARRHPPARHASPTVTETAVRFSVLDNNTSLVPCVADGKQYTIAGELFLPASGPPTGVTLYAHGLGYAGYFWDFDKVPGYDYAAAEAADGHASLVIDRLGYGASSIPAGSASCVGSQATILHEIVADLKSGDYTDNGASGGPSFQRVGLVGHSAGGELAEVEAYSYRDVAAVGIMEWADFGYSVGTYEAFAGDATQCVAGTGRQTGSSSTGYAAFGQTPGAYDQLMFADADPVVEADATDMRTLDPCGQIESILNAVAVDAAMIGSIKAPIAYVHAGADAIFQSGLPWAQTQEALYGSSSKVTDISLPGAGHAVTLEHSAPALEAAMDAWLQANHL